MKVIKNITRRTRHLRRVVRIGWFKIMPEKKLLMTDKQYEAWKHVIEKYAADGMIEVKDISRPDTDKPVKAEPEKNVEKPAEVNEAANVKAEESKNNKTDSAEDQHHSSDGSSDDGDESKKDKKKHRRGRRKKSEEEKD